MEKQERASTIVFTGGGTGGHVYPGIAVIQVLRRKWKGSFLWVGSRSGMERAIVEAAGIPFAGIPAGKLRRYVSFQNLLDVFRVARAVLASLRLFRRVRPVLVFSKGGYVSFPPVFAARLLGIPVLAHESDADPGLATLLSAPFAHRILVPYPESPEHFPSRFRKKLIVTGNPVREEIFSGRAEEGLRIAGFPGDRPVLLVLGGSQGAREINSLVREALDELLAFCRVVHQMGEGDYRPLEKEGYFARPYFSAELPHLLAASSAVVSRAGAGSLWEFLSLGLPALLLPLQGSGTRGDQVRNAELFERLGAARVFRRGGGEDGEERGVESGAFVREVRRILEPDTAAGMREAMARVSDGGAAERIAGLILDSVTKEAQ